MSRIWFALAIACFSLPGAVPLKIVAPAIPSHPFTVAGRKGAILGLQNGQFEAWVWPVKILSNFRIRAELADYPVPIDVNALAAEIIVTPAETTVTFSHAAFTIRQHMFASSLGANVRFEIESTRPLDLTFSFTPEMLKMWPAPNFGRPNSEWVQKGDQGAYLLHTDNPEFSAVVAMSDTRPGIMPPYQERPQTYATEFKLSFDPRKDASKTYPLVMAMSDGGNAVDQAARLIQSVPRALAATEKYYDHFFENRLTIETPDNRLNDALRWAEVSIDQAQVDRANETGLTAGYYESADSARPGYAWFFGRDTLFTTYAVNSYGDFALTRRALDFLWARQRDDGKIMHEYSQAADSIDWKNTPYFYASADSTLLMIMALRDYVRNSGDINYLKQYWAAAKKAWSFIGYHSDPEGLYNNSEGTGWVESWPPGMPKREIYMACLDQQTAQAMSSLASLMSEPGLANAAHTKALAISKRIESDYFNTQTNFYAFSWDNGVLDNTASIYPSVAWWDGDYKLENPSKMLSRWASQEFSTDWGTRDISPKTSFYDPISYHQGSIWPLFTGWVSLAEYRAGRPLSGYAHLMENVNLTWDQDLGAVTELLSGEFYQPLGRSSSHQLWSSAMVVTPLIRGLFGIEVDALKHTVQIRPSLPAQWNEAKISNVLVGDSMLDLIFQKNVNQLKITVHLSSGPKVCLTTDASKVNSCAVDSLTIPLAPVEIDISTNPPLQGATTSALKVMDEQRDSQSITYTLAAPAGTKVALPVRINHPNVKVDGASLVGKTVEISFPGGTGYQEKKVQFHW